MFWIIQDGIPFIHILEPFVYITCINRIAEQDPCYICCRNYQYRMAIFNDFFICLVIHVTGSHHDSKLSVTDPRNEAGHRTHAYSIMDIITFSFQSTFHMEWCIDGTSCLDDIGANGISSTITPGSRQIEFLEIVIHHLDDIYSAHFKALRKAAIMFANFF